MLAIGGSCSSEQKLNRRGFQNMIFLLYTFSVLRFLPCHSNRELPNNLLTKIFKPGDNKFMRQQGWATSGSPKVMELILCFLYSAHVFVFKLCATVNKNLWYFFNV